MNRINKEHGYLDEQNIPYRRQLTNSSEPEAPLEEVQQELIQEKKYEGRDWDSLTPSEWLEEIEKNTEAVKAFIGYLPCLPPEVTASLDVWCAAARTDPYFVLMQHLDEIPYNIKENESFWKTVENMPNISNIVSPDINEIVSVARRKHNLRKIQQLYGQPQQNPPDDTLREILHSRNWNTLKTADWIHAFAEDENALKAFIGSLPSLLPKVRESLKIWCAAVQIDPHFILEEHFDDIPFVIKEKNKFWVVAVRVPGGPNRHIAWRAVLEHANRYSAPKQELPADTLQEKLQSRKLFQFQQDQPWLPGMKNFRNIQIPLKTGDMVRFHNTEEKLMDLLFGAHESSLYYDIDVELPNGSEATLHRMELKKHADPVWWAQMVAKLKP